MPLSIACTKGHEFKVAASRAGSSVRCPHCREKVIVPQAEEKKSTRQRKTKEPRTETEPKAEPARTEAPARAEPTAESTSPKEDTPKNDRNESKAAKKKRRRRRERDTKDAKKKQAAEATETNASTEPTQSEQPIVVLPVATEGSASTERSTEPPPAPPAEPTPPPKIRVELPEVEAPPAATASKPPPLPQNEPVAAEVAERQAESPAAETSTLSQNKSEAPAEPATEKLVVDIPPLVTGEATKEKTLAEKTLGDEIGEPMAAPRAGENEKQNAEPEAVVVGYAHDAEKIWSAYVIAGSLALVGIVTMVPSGWSIVDYFRFEGETPISRWAWFLLFTGFLQIAYSVYVLQLPDFSTVWMTAIFLLVIATIYAMSLGMILLGGDPVLGIFEVHVLLRNKAGLWLFLMLCMTGLVAYFCGRVSVRWQKAFELATEGNNE